MTERGSVLMLMPAAILIVVALSAVAVDLSTVLLAQRELASAADAAANDAVTYGIDEDHLRRGGRYRLDPGRVERAVTAALRTQGLATARREIEILGARTVRVTLRRWVTYIFAPAIPGSRGRTAVTAGATATAEVR